MTSLEHSPHRPVLNLSLRSVSSKGLEEMAFKWSCPIITLGALPCPLSMELYNTGSHNSKKLSLSHSLML